ncbi:MAG TPA: hypothetical protein DC054_22165 [Blastocatellia bacterium]|nr:hypothetical protein [Blastocatellia bacterium]
MELSDAVSSLQQFGGADLTKHLATVEVSLIGVTKNTCANVLVHCGAQNDVLAAAGLVKQIAGQINVVIHALGILLCLPAHAKISLPSRTFLRGWPISLNGCNIRVGC